MAFNSANFSWFTSVVQNLNGIAWKYTTSDTLSTVEGTAGYFSVNSNIKAPVRDGDVIAVQASDGVALYVVVGDSSPSVTIEIVAKVSGASNLTAFAGATVF